MRLVTWLIVLIALSSEAQWPSAKVIAQTKNGAGLIDGIVTYENRTPVKNATVYAVPMGRPVSAIMPHADTDETGYFAIHIFPVLDRGGKVVAHRYRDVAADVVAEKIR